MEGLDAISVMFAHEDPKQNGLFTNFHNRIVDEAKKQAL
jgi:hypothetical protein